MRNPVLVKESLLRVENGLIRGNIILGDSLFLISEYIFEKKGREVELLPPSQFQIHILERLLLFSREYFAAKIGITKIFKKDGSLLSIC